MSQDYLGLYDTRPDRHEIRLSLLLVGVSFAALAVLSIMPNVRLRQINVIVPMVDTAMFLGDMVTATLLYAQASVFRSRALTVLASGYAFTALMLVAHVLTFPGAFAAGGLLGAKVNTTGWIANFWRAGLPIAVILYVQIKRKEPALQPQMARPRARIAAGVLAAVLLAAAATTLATIGHDLLPQLFLNRTDVQSTNLTRINCGLIAILLVALATLLRSRKSVLDMWLLVAIAAWLAHTLLNLQSWSRFTVNFYGQYGLLLFSHFIVMLALIAESNRLYARLALSTSARDREREARLMSMDAVTAAISHEVGQPLTAVALNASAALKWLTQSRPNVSKAITSLRAIRDDSKRTFDVIKSIRAMFGKGPEPATAFSLNDLVRETALVMDRDFALAKVSLVLALDESLPPIRADRVQIQRVLVNLLTNAIESLGTVPRRTRLLAESRPRRITIRTGKRDRQDVQLEVSDTGIGIAADELEHIFEPFHTTKASGTGLGLALCRTIVEGHDGRLWASQGDEYGATFHLRLPYISLPAINEISRSPKH